MDPFFHTGLSISDSLKTVRKSVLIYETIIPAGQNVISDTVPSVGISISPGFSKILKSDFLKK